MDNRTDDKQVTDLTLYPLNYERNFKPFIKLKKNMMFNNQIKKLKKKPGK